MTKIEMAKYIHLQMENVLPFARANSIKTALQTCNLLTGQSISNKFINWFRLNLPPEMAKYVHICKLQIIFTFANG